MNTRQQLSFSFRFEAVQIHFLRDIFVAVAITVAPYWQQNTYCTTHSLAISCQPTRQSRSSSKSTVCWLRSGVNEKHSCSIVTIHACYHKNNPPPALMTSFLGLLIICWFPLLASSFNCYKHHSFLQSLSTPSYTAISLTWPKSTQVYWNKRKCLHKKRIQCSQDCLGSPTWPPFHCFGTPIWLPWCYVKTLYIIY